MRTALRLIFLAAIAAPALALAQASVELRLGLPVVLPQLVVVQPGIQVVPDVDEEVFYTNGWYWVRQDGGWYRSHSHRGGWMPVPAGRVPGRLGSLPPGQYRRWHGPPPRAPRPAPARMMLAPQRASGPDLHWRGPDGDRGGDHDRGERGHGGHGKGHDKGRGRGHDRD